MLNRWARLLIKVREMSSRAAGVLMGLCVAAGVVVSESGVADAVGAQVTNVALTALPDGVRTTFSVIAVDAAGNRSAPVAVTVALPDDTGPGPARLVSTSRTRSSISVRWQSAVDQTGVSSYRVELVGRTAVTTKGRSVRFAGLSSATTYEIRITPIDRLGNVGVTVVLFVTTR
jgi:hypothetical protein